VAELQLGYFSTFSGLCPEKINDPLDQHPRLLPESQTQTEFSIPQ
jgi:hypothetical protein